MKKQTKLNITKIIGGDIRIITKVDKVLLEKLKKCSFYGDYSYACKTRLAKRGAVLVRVNDDKFIDITYFNDINKCNNLKSLLNMLSFDNNIFLDYGIKNPKVGQLYFTNIRTLNREQIKTLKLKPNTKI